MKNVSIVILLCVFSIVACTKDYGLVQPEPEVIDMPGPEPESVNQAPNSFLLLSPEMESTIVNRTPTFSWEQATDPDGDVVSYDLFLGTQENPSTLLAENLSTTSFTVTQNLEFETQYYWKVVAKDDKGAGSERIQAVLIAVPIKHLNRFDPNDEGGDVKIGYSQGKLIRFGDFVATNNVSSAKLELLKKPINSGGYEYKYTETGKQSEVYFEIEAGSYRWTFKYDQSDRIESIEIEYQGITSEYLSKSVFKYTDATDTNPNSIESTFQDEIVRHTLVWKNNNIVEVLSEIYIPMDDDFQFGSSTKIEYDDNINPYYSILIDQFGFDPFHVLADFSTSLESIEDFGIFKWQSFNNITAYEVFDAPNAEEPVGGYRMTFVYSQDYYPLSASKNHLGQNLTHQITWSYLEE